jgi:hypothetical protein
MKEDQGKKISPVVSDAAVKEVIPAKPAKPTALSDEDLDNVAGGGLLTPMNNGLSRTDVVKLNCVNDKL